MAIEKLNIVEFLQLSKERPVLDVRSPAEYLHAHFPGAINMPLFSDAERKEVGTLYKQESRESAIKKGLDFFGLKMRPMLEQAERLQHKSLLIHCWRGGMRSAGVAWLMDLYGYKVCTLAGGYKKFRQYVLETFSYPFRLNILGGYTGSGKTQVLRALEKRGESVIDLEAIALHRGSAFGDLEGITQPSQEMFENILAMELRSKTGLGTIWLEDESQRIGNLNISPSFWKYMRASPGYFIDIPFEERLTHIADEYGKTDPEKLQTAILRIQKRLGGLETRNAIRLLLEGRVKECFRILLKYYDKWYAKGMDERRLFGNSLRKISLEKVESGLPAEKLLAINRHTHALIDK